MFSLESHHRGDSNEYTQYSIFQYKEENHPKLAQNLQLWDFFKGLKNKFKTAVVNELSLFEQLNVYCITVPNHIGFYL